MKRTTLVLTLVALAGSVSVGSAAPFVPPADRVIDTLLNRLGNRALEYFLDVPDQTTAEDQRKMPVTSNGRMSPEVQTLKLTDNAVREFYHFRIADLIYVRSSRSFLRDLLRTGAVAPGDVYPVPRLILDTTMDEPVPGAEPAEDSGDGPEKVDDHLDQTNVRPVWEQGFHGDGVVIGIIDTGVNPSHHAFAGRYRGIGVEDPHAFNWVDVTEEASPTPKDADGHGTKVAGIALGGTCETADLSAPIGVAPAARWIACRLAEGEADTDVGAEQFLKCLDWMWSPTSAGVINTEMSPHVIQFSGHFDDMAPDLADRMRGVFESVEAAGIVFVHSIGNIVAACPTSAICDPLDAPPSSLDTVLTVGAVDERGEWFESFCSGQSTPTKPDLVAPGKNVRTSWGSTGAGNCGSASGTSVAAPVVSGVVALLLEAKPCLREDPATVREIVRGAVRTRSGGPDCHGAVSAVRVYGSGLVDAAAAIERAKSLSCP